MHILALRFLYSPKSLPADAPFFFAFIYNSIDRCFKSLPRQPPEGRNAKKAGEKQKLYVRGGDPKTDEIHINTERRYDKVTFYDRSKISLTVILAFLIPENLKICYYSVRVHKSSCRKMHCVISSPKIALPVE